VTVPPALSLAGRADGAVIGAAAAAATAAARRLGVDVRSAEVLHAGANVVARLGPASLVARVAHWTALVRRTPADALSREVAMAGWLHARGVPVVPPSALVPPGPHREDGHVLTFWTAAGAEAAAGAGEAGASLAALHAALSGYGAELPHGPAALVADSVGAVEVAATAGLLPAADARAVVAGASSADALPAAGPALHGDPHPRNRLATSGGVAWNDFEDAFRGPLEWDVAILRGTAGVPGDSEAGAAAALAAYEAAAGVRLDRELLAACARLREWQALCWTLLSAVHRPERVSDADRRLTRWLAS